MGGNGHRTKTLLLERFWLAWWPSVMIFGLGLFSRECMDHGVSAFAYLPPSLPLCLSGNPRESK